MLWLNPVSLSGRVVDSLAYLGFFFLQDYSFVLRIPWDSFRFFFFFWWIEWNCFRWLWILSSFQGFFVMLGDSWGFPFSFLFQRTLCWDYLGFCLDCYELFDTCKHSSRFFWNQREFFRDSSEMLLLFVSLSDLESFGICSSFDDLS